MSKKQLVYDKLADMGIPFQTVEHVAVFTIEEMQILDFPPHLKIAKNLFLRDAKGKRHFLVVVDAQQEVNLKHLEKVLNSTKLSFASEERLQTYLGLTKGAVSPFGLLNDTDNHVEVYFDKKLREGSAIGIHPNDNTATVFITFENLLKFIEAIGHQVKLIDFVV
ncbi:MAG TPA: prolyl-tRNA synthetase associated domain-containing protein [Clostridiales bacterium]|nr:prolyl-tRNA synthetase associated domain-containing protein [Clostridiales bacterium]